MGKAKPQIPDALLIQVSKALRSGATTWALALLNEYEVPAPLRKALLSRAKGSEMKRSCGFSTHLARGDRLAELSSRERSNIRRNMCAEIAPISYKKRVPPPRLRANTLRRSVSRVPSFTWQSTRRAQASSMPVSRLSSNALS